MNTLEDQLVASTGLDVREIAEMLTEVDALIAQSLGVVETQLNNFFNAHGAEVVTVLNSINSGVAELGAAMESFTNTDVVKEIAETTKLIHAELVGVRQDGWSLESLLKDLLVGVASSVIGTEIPKLRRSQGKSTSPADTSTTSRQSPGTKLPAGSGAAGQTPKRLPPGTAGMGGAGRAGVTGAAVGGGLLALEQFVNSDAFASLLETMGASEENIQGFQDSLAEWLPYLHSINTGMALAATGVAVLGATISSSVLAVGGATGAATAFITQYHKDLIQGLTDAWQGFKQQVEQADGQDSFDPRAVAPEDMPTLEQQEQVLKEHNRWWVPGPDGSSTDVRTMEPDDYPSLEQYERAKEYRKSSAKLWDTGDLWGLDQALKDFGAAITEGSYADLFSGNVSLTGNPGMLASASSHHSESVTNFNGPITVETKATDGYLLARDFRKALDAEFADIARSFDSGTY